MSGIRPTFYASLRRADGTWCYLRAETKNGKRLLTADRSFAWKLPAALMLREAQAVVRTSNGEWVHFELEPADGG